MSVYGKVTEEVPENCPTSLGKEVHTILLMRICIMILPQVEQ